MADADDCVPNATNLRSKPATHWPTLTIDNNGRHCRTPKCCHITPILHSLHWLKITERIEYKLLSLIYKVLTTNQPPYLHNLISVQPPCNTRSSYHLSLIHI